MKTLRTSIAVLGLFTLITGLMYPMVITGTGAVLFPYHAGGSLIRDGNVTAGSELVGQAFSGPRYFHGRPSSSNYDAMNSGGTNLGPTNKKLYEAVKERAGIVRKQSGLDESAKIPAELVYSSGSGLDPHISLEGALIQAPRVARERNMDLHRMNMLVRKNTKKTFMNFYGEPLVNVLLLNRSLDSGGGK